MSLGAERIRQYVKANPGGKLTALLHHLTPETLFAAYFALKAERGPRRRRDNVADVRGRTDR